jgi:MFS family permease
LVSIWHLEKMHEPPAAPAVPEPPHEENWWERIRASRLARFSLFYAAMQFSVAIASPFFALYMLRDLHFSYLQFMATTAASVLMHFLTLSTWGRLSDYFGNRFVLAITGFLTAFVPALWLVSDRQAVLILVQFYSGAVWAGFTLSAGNYLYDLVPAHKRVTYMAYHNVLANGGIFLGALLGGWLAIHLPAEMALAGGYALHLPSALLGVFFVSFVARLVAAAVFLPRLREVRATHPVSFGPLLQTGLVPIKGLAFDLLVRLRAISLLER